MTTANPLPRRSPLPDARLAALAAEQLPRLTAFVRRQVRNVADADDIVQDALAELFAAEKLLKPIEQAGAWLATVARRLIIDRGRSRSRRATFTESELAGPDAATPHDVDAFEAPATEGPEARYDAGRVLDAISAALAELPSEQRAAFVAHEVDGRSFRELAAASGTPVNTLLGRKYAAVQQLRRRLDRLYRDPS